MISLSRSVLRILPSRAILLVLLGVGILQTALPCLAKNATNDPVTSVTITPTAPTPTDVVTLNITEGPYSGTPDIMPSGTIRYALDQNGFITVPLDGSGAAAVVLGQLAVGKHSVFATYSGDAHYNQASSSYSFDVLDTKFGLIGSAWEVIQTNGNHGENYAAVDSKDNVYFTNPLDSVIKKLDPLGNFTTVPSTGLSDPQGIAIDAFDNLYIADTGNSRIVMITPAGVQTTLPIRVGTPFNMAFDPARQQLYITDRNEQYITRFNLTTHLQDYAVLNIYNLTAVAVSPTGAVFFSQASGAGNGGLYRAVAGVPVPVPTPIYSPSALAFDKLGNLYITDDVYHTTWRMTPDGHFEQISDIEGGLAVDSRGLLYSASNNIYIYNHQNSINLGNTFDVSGARTGLIARVYYRSTSTENLASFAATPANGSYNLGVTCNGAYLCYDLIKPNYSQPGAVTGYVTATSNLGTVLTNNYYGVGIGPEMAFSPGSRVQRNGQELVQSYGGVFVDPTGSLVVADTAANELRSIFYDDSGSGPFATVIVNSLGLYSAPTVLAPDAQGNIYLLESGKSLIHVLTPAKVDSVVFDLSAQTNLQTLTTFALDSAMNLWIGGTDASGTGMVLLKDTQGTTKVFAISQQVPTALAVDAFGTLYMADAATGKLQKFDHVGNATVIATGLNSPASIAVDPSGVVYVAGGTGNPLMQVMPDGTKLATPAVYIPNASLVYVDNGGNLLVADNANLITAQVDRHDTQVYSFGDVPVNTGSPVFQSQFINVGNQNLGFFSGFPGDTTFVPVVTAATCTLSTILAPGQACEQDYTFEPVLVTPASTTGYAYVTQFADAQFPTYNQYNFLFAGNGTAPAPIAVVTPSALVFEVPTAASPRPNQVVTLTNAGSALLNIASIATTGDAAFAQTNTCGPTLAIKASCTVTVTYLPTQQGNNTGALIFTDDSDSGTTQTVSLNGAYGLPSATLGPAIYNFANVAVGGSSQNSFTLTNTGPLTLGIASIHLSNNPSGDYTYTSTCLKTLAPHATCSITVAFKPSIVAEAGATLNVTDDAGTQTSTLDGIGVPPLALSPSSYSFGEVAVGTAGQTLLELINNTSSAIAIPFVQLSSGGTPFTLTNNCPAGLAAHTSCAINVAFAPVSAGVTSTNAIVVEGSGGNSAQASVDGTGFTPSTSLTPTDYTFPTVPVGAPISSNFILTNTSGGPIPFNLAYVSPGVFFPATVSNNCPSVIPAGGSCTITVTFTPGIQGDDSTLLNVVAGNSHTVATLHGFGAPREATLTPAKYLFPSTPVGSSSSTSFTLTNNSVGSLVLTSATLTAPLGVTFPGTISNNCPASLAFQSSCLITVTFKPTAPGAFSSGINVLYQGESLSASVVGTTPVNLVVTKVLTRTGGNVIATLTIANTGGTDATNVVLSSVKAGADTVAALPIGTINAGGSAVATVSFPGSVGTSGAASSLVITCTYSGGTFSSSTRITLP